MFTLKEMSNLSSALSLKQEDAHSYNYYINTIGLESTLNLYGQNKDSVQYNLKNKSKEYNRINKDFEKISKELEDFGRSLKEYLVIASAKLRSLERNNPNNYEDFNVTLKTVIDIKKQQLDVITSKQKAHKDKHDLLQKQTKLEQGPTGGDGNGNGGSGIPIIDLARNITARPNRKSTPAPQGPTVASSKNTVEEDDTGVKSFFGASQSGTYDLPTGGDKGTDRMNKLRSMRESSGLNYSTALTKYGADAMRETYKLNPDTGVGYVEFSTPQGEVGIKELPIKNFLKPVDFDNMILTDQAGIQYGVEFTKDIPDSVSRQWNPLLEDTDGVNVLGIKK